MSKFIIQTVNNHVEHDFCFHLVKAIEFQNNLRNDKVHTYKLMESSESTDGIPIGSLEFVFDHLERHKKIARTKITPINIPLELFKTSYLKRECSIHSNTDLSLQRPMFLKSNSQYKKYTDIISDEKDLPEDVYFVSEVVEIESEWRAFILNRQLVGIKQYVGDFRLFPDIKLIEEMIKDYRECPPAYTLDVGINSSGTFLIEVHPFVSCGLYGFANYNLLPVMFSSSYYYLLSNVQTI